MNKKSIGIMVVALGLTANASYLIYTVFLVFSLSNLIWAVLGLIAAYGVFTLRRWSTPLVVIIAALSLSAWGDVLIQTYGKTWPNGDLSETIISFIPGCFLVLWWVCAPLCVIRYLRTTGTVHESKKETNCA